MVLLTGVGLEKSYRPATPKKISIGATHDEKRRRSGGWRCIWSTPLKHPGRAASASPAHSVTTIAPRTPRSVSTPLLVRTGSEAASGKNAPSSHRRCMCGGRSSQGSTTLASARFGRYDSEFRRTHQRLERVLRRNAALKNIVLHTQHYKEMTILSGRAAISSKTLFAD